MPGKSEIYNEAGRCQRVYGLDASMGKKRRRSSPAPLDTSRLASVRISRYYLDMLRFDWDERKNKSNRIKYGVWFEEAQSVFNDPHGRLFYDPEHSKDEERSFSSV